MHEKHYFFVEITSRDLQLAATHSPSSSRTYKSNMYLVFLPYLQCFHLSPRVYYIRYHGASVTLTSIREGIYYPPSSPLRGAIETASHQKLPQFGVYSTADLTVWYTIAYCYQLRLGCHVYFLASSPSHMLILIQSSS